MTWKWSPPPVRSSTSISPSGEGPVEQIADRFVAIGNDANDGRPRCLPALPAGARGPLARSRSPEGGVHETAELCCRGSCAARDCTRRRPRTCCESRSSSSAGSRLRPGVGRRVRARTPSASPCARRPEMPSSSARSRRSGSRRCGCSPPPQTSRAGPASTSTPSCGSSRSAGVLAEDAHARVGRRAARGARGRDRGRRPG